MIIAGDFNATGIDWKNLLTESSWSNKGMCNRLINILGSHQLSQLVHEPTRQKSILDLFCINKPSLIKNVCYPWDI